MKRLVKIALVTFVLGSLLILMVSIAWLERGGPIMSDDFLRDMELHPENYR